MVFGAKAPVLLVSMTLIPIRQPRFYPGRTCALGWSSGTIAPKKNN